MSAHIVLLGDSVFDNAPYVRPGESVGEELARVLPAETALTVLARDGAVAGDIYGQLSRLPADATQLVLSVGGNDAVSHWSVLEEEAGRVRDGLERMGAVLSAFAAEYAELVDAVTAHALPLTLCTIYEGDFSDSGDQPAVNAAVALFDSAIYRCAAARGLRVIELRDACNTPEHFTQLIEPSAAGSRAIAAAVAARTTQRA